MTLIYFQNQSIAYSTNIDYYLNNTLGIIDKKELAFAKVTCRVIKYGESDFSLIIEPFRKAKSISEDNFYDDVILNIDTIKQKPENFFKVRYATLEEINKLQELIESDKIELAYRIKEEAKEILEHYLDKEIPLELSKCIYNEYDKEGNTLICDIFQPIINDNSWYQDMTTSEKKTENLNLIGDNLA